MGWSLAPEGAHDPDDLAQQDEASHERGDGQAAQHQEPADDRRHGHPPRVDTIQHRPRGDAGGGARDIDGPIQATTDAQLVALWLGNRPASTQRAYRREASTFLLAVGKPLGAVTLADVHAFIDGRRHLAPATQARTIHAVKSLFAFAQRVGYLQLNVCAVVQAPPVKDTLGERILPEADVYAMLLASKASPRDHLLLLLAYASGGRVSELVGLCWRDVQPRDEGGQVVLFGKRGKTRSVLLPPAAWKRLLELRHGGPDDPVFVSRSGGRLSTVQAWRVVRAAARKAGLAADVSPHWLRHAHASHALDRGAPISLVQATLGHASVATMGRYLHARPSDSSGRYLGLKDLS